MSEVIAFPLPDKSSAPPNPPSDETPPRPGTRFGLAPFGLLALLGLFRKLFLSLLLMAIGAMFLLLALAAVIALIVFLAWLLIF